MLSHNFTNRAVDENCTGSSGEVPVVRRAARYKEEMVAEIEIGKVGKSNLAVPSVNLTLKVMRAKENVPR